jgi:hypothetical protein
MDANREPMRGAVGQMFVARSPEDFEGSVIAAGFLSGPLQPEVASGTVTGVEGKCCRHASNRRC